MADPGGWRRLHWTWVIYSGLRSLRTLALPIAVALITGGGRAGEIFALVIGLFFVSGAIAVRSLLWTRIAYRVDERGIALRSGLLSRNERFLPVDRVQAVEVQEGVMHRLLGIVALKIESAAGSGGEADITLEALARYEAERARGTLLRRAVRASAATGEATVELSPDVVDEGELIAALSMERLLIAGATSGRIGPALGLIFGALQFGDELLPGDTWEQAADILPEASVSAVAAVALAGAVLAWLFAIASTVLTYGNFQLRRVGDRLQATYGLLDRRRVSIPLARVQAVVISEGLLRQPFGLAAVRAESAGYGKDTAESGVLMPLLHRRELPALLERACPAYALDPATVRYQHPPRRALRRYVMAPVWSVLLLVAAVLAAAIIIDRLPWLWGLSPMPVALPAAVLGWLRFHDDGWQVRPDGRFVLRARPLYRVTTITAVRRLQHRAIVQSPLQRRARLVSFAAAVASGGSGGSLGIAHIDQDDGARLLDQLAFQPRTAPVLA